MAEQCPVYIYNVALRLGVPIKGASGLCDGIELFPRQDRLAPGKFGNALRGHSESIVPTTTATGFTMPAVTSPPN